MEFYNQASSGEVLSEHVIWDTEVNGLGQRCRNGKTTWILQNRVQGKTTKKTLCSGTVSITKARELALASNTTANIITTDIPSDINMSDFWVLYFEHARLRLKPRTQRAYSQVAETYILPSLGRRHVTSLNKSMVRDWHKSFGDKHETANKAMAVLGGMMRHGELLELRPANTSPCKGFRKHKSQFKAQYLQDDEWNRLGLAFERLMPKHPFEVAALKFLSLTGCRNGEARSLKWEMIQDKIALLPDTKTGERLVVLPTPVLRLLNHLPSQDGYVFSDKAAPMSSYRLAKVWAIVCEHAQFENLRIHDLRHSYASMAINQGIDLPPISGLLGHKDIATTACYAHIQQDTVRQAAARVGVHMTKAMSSKNTSVKDKKRVLPTEVSVFKEFICSKLPLQEFCRVNNLEKKAFHKKMVKWRALTKGARL